jgi:lipopolysaccharide export system protein LptA
MLLATGLLLAPAYSFALKSDQAQPMHLEADSVEIDDEKGVSLYQGNVIITQGSFKLWADRMWIHRQAGKTEKILAEGNPARFRQLMDETNEEVRGRARKASIVLDRDEVQLVEEAVIEQGKDSFSSDRILFVRSKSLIKAGAIVEGKQRVQVVIEPKKDKE